MIFLDSQETLNEKTLFIQTTVYIEHFFILWEKNGVVLPLLRPGGRPSGCYFEAASFSAAYVLVHVTSSGRWANRSEQRSSCTRGTETASDLLLLPSPPQCRCSLLSERRGRWRWGLACVTVYIMPLNTACYTRICRQVWFC